MPSAPFLCQSGMFRGGTSWAAPVAPCPQAFVCRPIVLFNVRHLGRE